MSVEMTDERVVLLCKNAKMTTKQIAERMGKSEAEVERIWNALCEAQNRHEHNGHGKLVEQVQILAAHYQQVGEYLKVIGMGLSNECNPSELAEVIDTTPKGKLAEVLLSKYIILQTFSAPDPMEQMRLDMDQN